MAGCLAPAPQWGKFERKWLSILRDAGVPENMPFHATDFMAKKKLPYKDWPNTKHAKVYWDLVKTIEAHSILIVATGLIKADYQRFWNRYGYPIPEAHSPVSFCATLCLAQMARWTESNNYRESIAYIFEAGNYPMGEVENVYRAINGNERNAHQYRVNSVAFSGKAKCISLQAADLVAWELNYYYANNFPNPAKPIRAELCALMKKTPFCEQLVTCEQLEEKWPERIRARKHQKKQSKGI